MQETWVWSLGWEDPLEKEMVTHSSILAWRIPWMEKPGKLQSMGLQRVRHDWATSLTHSFTHSLVAQEYSREFTSLSQPGICKEIYDLIQVYFTNITQWYFLSMYFI